MGKLERLKVLYKERYLEHNDIDAWNEAIEKEWPKILAVVEAAKRLRATVTVDDDGWQISEDELIDECETFDIVLAMLES